jgi:Rab-GTPase-TBC domain
VGLESSSDLEYDNSDEMSNSNCANIEEFNEVFIKSTDGLLTGSARQKLCEKFWCQDSFMEYVSPSNRCIYWRYLFGIISRTDQKLWLKELKASVEEYSKFKTSIFPSISNVGFDPLSDDNPDTLSYFESVEKVKSIELDLNRLYINGIEEEYFQTKRRNRILQSVLLIWSVQNPIISYRQGNTLRIDCR